MSAYFPFPPGDPLSQAPHENLFQNAFHFAAIGMALVALDGRWLKVNRALCELVGYAEAELLKLSFQEITYPADLEVDLEYLASLLRGERSSYQMEKRYLRKDGSIVWILLNVSLVRAADGSPEFCLSQIQDIDARKRAELVRETLFQIPVALHFVAGYDGYFKQLSLSWEKFLGYPLSYLLSVPYLDLVHPEDREETILEATRVTKLTNTFQFENRYRHADGTYRWVLWTSSSVEEQQLVYGVALDNTARKEVELQCKLMAEEKDQLLAKVNSSRTEIESLRQGLLTVCAWTKRIQHDGRWMSADEFLGKYLHLNLTHGISEEAIETQLARLEAEGEELSQVWPRQAPPA